ncbi:MAG TPA: hypothetical protein VFD45_02115 [Patescibacteria group bacterium]|nr:hypothetical protein [Patescibacteria group bacterium]
MSQIEMGVVYKPLPMGIEPLIFAHATASVLGQEENFDLGGEPPFGLKGDTKAMSSKNRVLNIFLGDMIENNLLPITTFSCSDNMEEVVFMAKWTMH